MGPKRTVARGGDTAAAAATTTTAAAAATTTTTAAVAATPDHRPNKKPTPVKCFSLNNAGRKKENEKEVQSKLGTKGCHPSNVPKPQIAAKESTRISRRDTCHSLKDKRNSESCANTNATSTNNQLRHYEKTAPSSNSCKNNQSGIVKETNIVESRSGAKSKAYSRSLLPPHPVAFISVHSKRFKQKTHCNENSKNENPTNINDKPDVRDSNENQNVRNADSRAHTIDLPDLVINSKKVLNDKSVDLIVNNDLTENVSKVCDEEERYSHEICSINSLDRDEKLEIPLNSPRGEEKWEVIETSSEIYTVTDSLELISDNSPEAGDDNTSVFSYYSVCNNSSKSSTINDLEARKTEDLANNLFSNMCDSSRGIQAVKCSNQMKDNKLINNRVASNSSSIVSHVTYVVDRPVIGVDVLKSMAQSHVQNDDVADITDFMPGKSQLFSSLLLEERSEAANNSIASSPNKEVAKESDPLKSFPIPLNNNNVISPVRYEPPATCDATISEVSLQSNNDSESAPSLNESNHLNVHDELFENSNTAHFIDDSIDDVDMLELLDTAEMYDIKEAFDGVTLAIIPVENSTVDSVTTNILTSDDEFDFKSEVISDVIDDIDAVWSDVKLPIRKRDEVADSKWTDEDEERRDADGESVVFLDPNDEDWIIAEKNLHELRVCLDECREEVELAAREMHHISNRSNRLSDRDTSAADKSKKQLNVGDSQATFDISCGIARTGCGSGGDSSRSETRFDDATDYFSVSSGDESSDFEDKACGDQVSRHGKASPTYLSFGKSCERGRKKNEKKCFSSLLSSFFKSKNIVEK